MAEKAFAKPIRGLEVIHWSFKKPGVIKIGDTIFKDNKGNYGVITHFQSYSFLGILYKTVTTYDYYQNII